MDLSGVGIWNHGLRYGDKAESADAAAELDELGYTALWIPDVGGTPVLDSVDHLLSATNDIVIATGILNLWMNDPSDVAASYASLTAAHGDRFLMGIGVSHAPLIDSTEPGRYRKPLAATAAFLDALDGAEQPVPVGARVLAALGPKMLELAANRSRGAHPVPRHARAHASRPRSARRRSPPSSRTDGHPHRRRLRGARHRNRLDQNVFGDAELREQHVAPRLLPR